MLSKDEFESTIQIVFKYLNTNISIYEIDSLEECKNLSLPFTKCLSKISSNKIVQYNGQKYVWSEISKMVREKMVQDKTNLVGHLATIYLEGDHSIDFLVSLPQVPFSSSSLQRYFKELLPQVPSIVYQGKTYTGEEFMNLLNEKLALQKSKAPQKGGEKSSIKTIALKDEKGHFMGSEKREKIKGKYSCEKYDRAAYEADLLLMGHSSLRLVAEMLGTNKDAIWKDMHKVLKVCNPSKYKRVCTQFAKNQDMERDDIGKFINAEEKYQKQKKRNNKR